MRYSCVRQLSRAGREEGDPCEERRSRNCPLAVLVVQPWGHQGHGRRLTLTPFLLELFRENCSLGAPGCSPLTWLMAPLACGSWSPQAWLPAGRPRTHLSPRPDTHGLHPACVLLVALTPLPRATPAPPDTQGCALQMVLGKPTPLPCPSEPNRRAQDAPVAGTLLLKRICLCPFHRLPRKSPPPSQVAAGQAFGLNRGLLLGGSSLFLVFLICGLNIICSQFWRHSQSSGNKKNAI